MGAEGSNHEALQAWAGAIFGMLFTFEMSPDGSSRFPWASQGIQEIFQVKAIDVVDDASALLARVHPDDIQMVREGIQRSRVELSVWNCEFRTLLPKGELHWIRGEAKPQALPDGDVRWRGHIVDITDVKESEARWRGAAQLLAMVADASPKALFVATAANSEHEAMGLPFVSLGVAEVLGVNPKMAMEDSRLVWSLFSEQMRARGLLAFERAKSMGKSDETLELTNGHGKRKTIKMSIEWVGEKAGKPTWVGYASDIGDVTREEMAWMNLSSSMEGRIGKDFLEGFAAAMKDSCAAKSCQAKWFDESLLWVVEEGSQIDWSSNGARIVVIDAKRHPVGAIDLAWDAEAPVDLSAMFKRAAALAHVHWERVKADVDLVQGLEAAKKDLLRSASLASMGSLVGGVAHDLSSPLSNGALGIEVIKSRAKKIQVLLQSDKISKGSLNGLAQGLAEVAEGALAEIDKARVLLESFKKIAGEQARGGMSKHELGKLLQDMRSSLHPTLRKRGVDLSWVESNSEIWTSLDVSETFNWLVKCAMSASNAERGAFAPKASLSVRALCKGGRALIEVALDQADADQVEAELGESLYKDSDGKVCARHDVGPGVAAGEET